MSIEAKHWGQWVKRRAGVVGIRSQCTMALKLRCSRQQLVKWFAMAEPPASMRKGFDAELVALLQTDSITLFRDWHKISPERSPLVRTPLQYDDGPLKRKLAACAELLPEEKLRKLVERGESLLREPAVA